MEAKFDKLGVKLYLPLGTQVYNKNEVLQSLGYSKQQQKSCLLVLGKPKTDWFLLLNYLCKVESKEEYQDILKEYLSTNNKIGLEIVKQEQFISEDGRKLDAQVFYSDKKYTITVFSLINNSIIYSLTHCNLENIENGVNFSLDIMKNLFSN